MLVIFRGNILTKEYNTVQYLLLIGIQLVSIMEFVNNYQYVIIKIIKMLFTVNWYSN